MGGAEGIKRWEDSYRGMEHVKLVDGRKPVTFTVRDLSLEEMLEIDSLPMSAAQVAKARAFRLAVECIEGAPGLSPDGTVWRPRAERETSTGVKPTASWADMEAIRLAIGYQRLLDIGEFAIRRGNLLGNGESGGAP
jgi:hypothetical protein